MYCSIELENLVFAERLILRYTLDITSLKITQALTIEYNGDGCIHSSQI